MKKTKTKQTMALAKAVPVPPITPKPTKSDVISAAVELSKRKWMERTEFRRKRIEEVETKIKAECLRLLSEPDGIAAFDCTLNVNNYSGNVTATLRFDMAGPTLKPLFKEYAAIPAHEWWNEEETRRNIREALDATGDRVQLILSNEENVQLLDQLLEKVSMKKIEV